MSTHAYSRQYTPTNSSPSSSPVPPDHDDATTMSDEDSDSSSDYDDDDSSASSSSQKRYRLPPFSWSLTYFRLFLLHRALLPLSAYLQKLWIGEKLALSYLYADTKRNKSGFFVGIFTVFLVVVLVAVLENNVGRSPVIFWRIAETTVGENDLILTSGFGIAGIQSLRGESSVGGITNLLMPQQILSEKLNEKQSVQGTTGRWILFGKIMRNASDDELITPATNNIMNNSVRTSSAYLLGIDSAIEHAIGLGRSWTLPTLGDDEIYLTRSIVREIGLDPTKAQGKSIILRLDMLDVAKSLNVGGIGGSSGTGAGSDAMNVTISHTSSEAEQIREAAREDDNTDEQNQALLLQLLIERASPNMTQQWAKPVTFGNDTQFVFAMIDYVNLTITSLPSSYNGEPIPLIPATWSDPTHPPPQFTPLVAYIKARYGYDVTPQQLSLLMLMTLQSAGIENPSIRWMNTSVPVIDYDSNTIILDPILVQRHLYALKNGTETYGDLLILVTPFILQFLRIDTSFKIASVVETPDGKWSEGLGSVVILENKVMMMLLAKSIQKIVMLQNNVNMSQPFNASGTIPGWPPAGSWPPGFPPITPPKLPSSALNYSTTPLERLLTLIFPAMNASTVHSSIESLQAVSLSLQNNTRSLLSVVQYSNRLDVYTKSLDDMNAELMQFTNYVSEYIGYDTPFTYTLPLATALKLTQYVRYFLDNIFGSIIFLLVLLGVLLIYSLLLNDVDSKTYEYGMLRALGMKHQTLIQILLSKSVSFSIPGISIGLFLAFLFNIPLAKKIASFANINPTYTFIATPIIIAICLGLFMPLLANIVPISRALSKTLRDSLDVYHVVINEITVQMIKLEELGIDLWQTCISVLLIVVGFSTFYIIPYAFTFQNIPLFIGILNAILLGMLLGLCIVAQLIQPYIEKLILRLMLWAYWPHKKLYGIIVKNLSSHSSRNIKTAQMFLICLAFLIFAGVMFNLQSRSLSDNIKVYVGSDIQIFSPLKDSTQHLKERDMRVYLEKMKQTPAQDGGDMIVQSYTFVSYPINYLLPVDKVLFSSLPQFPEIRQMIYGVEENYLDCVYTEFYDTKSINTGSLSTSQAPRLTSDSSKIDVVKLMYQDRGRVELSEEHTENSNAVNVPKDVRSVPWSLTITDKTNDTGTVNSITSAYRTYLDVLVSEAISGAGSISIHTPLHLSIRSWNEDISIFSDYLAKSRSMIIKLPGFFFSSYRQTAGSSSVVLSMDQYKRIMADVYGAYPIPNLTPKQKLLIKLSPKATRDEREDVINGLRIYFKSDKTQAINTHSVIGTMGQAIALMNLFFQLVATIAMIMCFFILWLSFKANVEENAWEFGVLRAIGLNSVEVVMIYIYEALALVLASVLLGTTIGIVIAATLTLQFNLFTELPFHMEFPTGLFLSMVSMAIGCATIGSGFPAYGFLKKTISSVLRRQ